MHARASSLASELDSGKQSRERDSPWKTLCSNSSGETQTPKDSRHAKVRARTVGRGFRSPKHKQELQKSYPSEESRNRSGFPQLESKAGESVCLLCRLVPSSFQQAQAEPTVTQPQALEEQTCTFGTPMYFRKRCRSYIFLCTERGKRPPVPPSQLLSSCQAGQQKARRGFWHWCDAHGPNPTGSPICSISQAPTGTTACHCHIPRARPWAPAP